MVQRALARVNVAAVERNVARLCAELAPGAELCAVVKADGYGHGAVPCARAAQAGGASSLAVATAEEAAGLREAGIEGPILVMGALIGDEVKTALAAGADVVAWDESFLAELERAATAEVGVHVKLDTGMGRLGTRDVEQATRVAQRVTTSDKLRLAGAMTHFATADEDPEFLAEQLGRFEPWARALQGVAPDIVVHASNSAATLRGPEAHFDLVRCGIAIYGMDPFHFDPAEQRLEPALSLHSYVAAVKLCEPGQSVGYGRRFVAEQDSWLATVPIGYGDGVRRGLTNNAELLVGGRRVPLVGTVSMDNVTVIVDESVRVGDPVVLIGADGEERVLAEEHAERLHTINYEITCGLSQRVPREHYRE